MEEVSKGESTFVFAETEMTGTFTGPGSFMGLKANGKELAETQFHKFEVRDGQIVAHWAWRNDIGALLQITGAKTPQDLLSGKYADCVAKDAPPQNFVDTNK
jgi:hypothetical protein